MNSIPAIGKWDRARVVEPEPKRPTGLLAGGSRYLARIVPTKPIRARNSQPIISFTFDDVPNSARTNGARILDRHNLRGTFYVAPGICGMQDEHWTVIDRRGVASLAASGHEVGCHTHNHVKVQTLSHAELARETELCFDTLSDICGKAPSKNFAYPFGNVSFPRKLQLDKHFTSCRSIYPGLNSGLIDLAMLRSVELYDRTSTEQSINATLDQAIATNAWVIFYTHDVAPNPSWIGCSPTHLEMAVKAVKARGITCLAVDEALDAIGVRA